MVGYDDLSEREIAAEDDMATLLSLNCESGLDQSGNTISTREARQFHTATRMASKFSTGTGRPSACKAAT